MLRCQLFAMRQLESLDVWRVAQELAQAAYAVTMHPGLSRHFALTDQMRRAAVSIPANIAEGYALASTAQFIRFLRISLGSAAELLSHLHLLRKLALCPDSDVAAVIALCQRVVSMLVGLLRKLSRAGGSRFPFPASRFPAKGAREGPPS